MILGESLIYSSFILYSFNKLRSPRCPPIKNSFRGIFLDLVVELTTSAPNAPYVDDFSIIFAPAVRSNHVKVEPYFYGELTKNKLKNRQNNGH